MKPTNPTRRICALLGVIGLFSLGLGCSGGENLPPVYPASGTVLLNGAPLEGATVVFRDAAGTARPATAVTDAQGNFRLSTYGTKDGAVAGSHIVTVSKNVSTSGSNESVSMEEAVEAGSQDAPKVSSEVPPQYSNPNQTPLKYEVTEDGANEFQIELE